MDDFYDDKLHPYNDSDDPIVVHSVLAGNRYSGDDFFNYRFDIKENFAELKEKLLKSMDNGLIKELATNEAANPYTKGYEHSKINWEKDGILLNFDDDDDCDELQELIRIEKDKIRLEKYKFNMHEIGDYVDVITIQPKANDDGCVVSTDLDSGGINFLEGMLQSPRDIFAGVRNEITYVPGTLSWGSDTKLLEDEEYKIEYSGNIMLDRTRQKLKRNQKLKPKIQEGMAMTKESGYGHISRTPKENVKTPAWMRKRQRGGQGE